MQTAFALSVQPCGKQYWQLSQVFACPPFKFAFLSSYKPLMIAARCEPGSTRCKQQSWTARLQSYGYAGVASYGLLNTAYYIAAFLFFWTRVAKVPKGDSQKWTYVAKVPKGDSENCIYLMKGAVLEVVYLNLHCLSQLLLACMVCQTLSHVLRPAFK